MSEAFRIDCIGDSLTSGVKPPSYPRLLRNFFLDNGMDHVQVSNRGKEGFTVAEYLEFQTTEPNISLLEKREVDVIIILLGTNDTRDTVSTTLEDYKEHYHKLLSIYKAKTNDIFVMNIPLYYPPVHIFWKGDNHTFDSVERISREFNPALAEIAQEMKLTVIDIHSPLKDAGETAFIDGIHPNEIGNKIIAKTCYQAVSTIVNNNSN